MRRRGGDLRLAVGGTGGREQRQARGARGRERRGGEVGSGRGRQRPGRRRAGVSKRDGGGKEKGAWVVLKRKYILRLTWVVPHGPCRVYSSVTDEYTR
jgi:hypothetical protein